MKNLKLTHHEILNNLLLLQWNDKSENIIPLQGVRDNCPCANCKGETDVFGNIYKGPAEQLNEESYKLSGLQPIGYYAVRPFWRDGHNAWIFTFELLKKLGDALDSSEV
jgi:DUF971 family protein